MIKKFSLVVLSLFVSGCSMSNENLEKVINKEESITLIQSLNQENENEILKFSFDGQWISENSSKMLQRKLTLKEENNLFAKGKLELYYKNLDGSINIVNEIEINIYSKMLDTIMYAKDLKTKKEEKAKIFRDGINEFRVVPLEKNSLLFDEDLTMFKKKSNYEKIEIEVNKKIIWQDSSSNKILKANYERAKLYCKNYKQDGLNWRLPTRAEIEKKILDENSFEYYVKDLYWTSDLSIDDGSKAWCFDYKTNKTKIEDKNKKLYIRCVSQEN